MSTYDGRKEEPPHHTDQDRINALEDIVREFIDLGVEFYDMDCGENGADLIRRARELLGDDE